MKESHIEYKKYIQNGKKFIYSKKIRSINQNMYDLLKSNMEIDTLDLTLIIDDLIEHLEQWIWIWEKKKKTLSPGDNDIFFFSGYKNFPKNFENILISYIKKKSE